MATTELKALPAPRQTRIQSVANSRLVFPVLIFLILAGFYWKLTLTTQFDWVWGPDLAQQVMPWFEEEARQIQHHELPLWDSHGWLGQPLLGQAQPGTAYPLNWLMFLVPRVHGHIHRTTLVWYYVIIHFMAGLFCYLLCRDLGRSRPASLIAGLVFALAAYVGTTDWPQMINGAVWAPLVFLFLLRAVRGHRSLVSAALTGAFLGTAWLAGHHQVPIYITLTMSFTWLYFILRKGYIDWNIVKLAAVCFLFVFLVGALQILPAEEYGHLAKRWAGAEHELSWKEPVPYFVHRQYAMDPMSLFGILIPGLNRHSDPFIGIAAFSLALMAVTLCWRQHAAVRLFGAIALGAIIYSLGANSVFQGFLYAALPLVDKARVPSMATSIWGFATAVLVAFGIDHFGLVSNERWSRRINLAVTAFAVIAWLMLLLAMFIDKMSWQVDDRVGITILTALLLAALLYAWRTANLTRNAVLTLLAMLVLFELGNDAAFAFPSRNETDRLSYVTKVTSDPDIAAYIHAQPGVYRAEAQTDKLASTWTEYYNFDAIPTLTASVLENVHEMEFHNWQNRMLLGVQFTVSEKPPLDNSQEVYTGQSGLKLYINPGAFPRAWAVHEMVHANNLNEIRVAINDHLGDLRAKAFTVEQPLALKPCNAADQVDIAHYRAERVDITANMGCDGLVILSDSFYPGWKATVDDKPVQIRQVDIALRAVQVPAGKHQIVMRYRPASVYLGAFLTAMGWLGALALVWLGPKSRRIEYSGEFSS